MVIKTKLPENFDWKIYLKYNQDLIKNGITSEIDAINHYLNHGYIENRIYYDVKTKLPENFDWVRYLSLNLDVALEISLNSDDVQTHYVFNSKKEKRIHDIGEQKSLYSRDKKIKILNPIYIFYHVYAKNDWKKIVEEQITIMIKSGLMDVCTKLFINVFGDDDDVEFLKKTIKKGNPIITKTNEQYEFPTLELISDICKKETFKGVYIHTKSSSYALDYERKDFLNLWRDIMNFHILTCWKDCYHYIQSYDLVGTLHRKGTESTNVYWEKTKNHKKNETHLRINHFGCTDHFSGNFWWFDSSYYAGLSKLSEEEKCNRFNAEWYPFKNNPDYKNFYLNKDHWVSNFKKILHLKNPHVKLQTQRLNIINFNENDYEIFKNHNLSSTDITVIITLFNYEKYINRAVDSVIQNNFKNCEILVVNDNSTDDSLNQIKKYLNQNINFTIINKKTNTGLIHSRNLGIEKCLGDYVFILDADNYLYSNCLEKHFNKLKKEKTIACYSTINCVDTHNNFVKTQSNESFNFEKLKKGNYIDAMAMFDKNKLKEIGNYDIDMTKVGIGWEDYELWLRIGYLGYQVSFINETLSEYLIKNNSMLSITPFFKDAIVNYLNKKYNININI